jgi:hypothetical protein
LENGTNHLDPITTARATANNIGDVFVAASSNVTVPGSHQASF